VRLLPLSRNYGWPTTRRYPRTLAEAWPREYASPIEHYTSSARMWETVAGIALAVVIGVGLAWWMFAWWSA